MLHLPIGLIRQYASSAAKKVTERGVKTKQVFMKKMKDNKAAAAATRPGMIGVNRTAPLTQALFSVDPACRRAADASRADGKEMEMRKVIEAAWRRHEEGRRAEQASWEVCFVEGKVRALNELKAVSPRLFATAMTINYSLPPVYRRMATLTPPAPDKFPFKQEL